MVEDLTSYRSPFKDHTQLLEATIKFDIDDETTLSGSLIDNIFGPDPKMDYEQWREHLIKKK